MTRTLYRTVLVCFFAVAALAGDRKPLPKESDSITKLTKGRNQYLFPTGASLRFARTKDGTIVLSSGGRELYRLPRGSFVEQTLQSPNRRALLLLLSKSTPIEVPKKSDFTMESLKTVGILSIYSDRSDRITCTIHMTEPQVPEKLRGMTIASLDSVLNDGLTVQLEVLRMSEEEGSTSSVCTAEVWDLEAHERLKVYDDYYD